MSDQALQELLKKLEWVLENERGMPGMNDLDEMIENELGKTNDSFLVSVGVEDGELPPSYGKIVSILEEIIHLSPGSDGLKEYLLEPLRLKARMGMPTSFFFIFLQIEKGNPFFNPLEIRETEESIFSDALSSLLFSEFHPPRLEFVDQDDIETDPDIDEISRAVQSSQSFASIRGYGVNDEVESQDEINERLKQQHKKDICRKASFFLRWAELFEKRYGKEPWEFTKNKADLLRLAQS